MSTLTYAQILTQHFLADMEKDLFICPVYVNLCTNYLCNSEDEIHELAFVSTKAFKTLRKIYKSMAAQHDTKSSLSCNSCTGM